ncbi:hypothetical protein C0J52_26357 [Blattella germanica]|nr:hypothetical protein C0J52_26357 [Blattella germanica]
MYCLSDKSDTLKLQEMKYNGQLERIRELHWLRKLQDSANEVSEIHMTTAVPIFSILGCGILFSVLFLFGEILRRKLAPEWPVASRSSEIKLRRIRNYYMEE